MTCGEIEIALLCAPRTDSAVLRAHLVQCAHCRRFAEDRLRLDGAIESAALAVRAPEGLSARVLLRQRA
jgi:hypothetical protein